MYAVYRQSDAASSVEMSVYCRFLGGDDRQLVTYGGCRLRVYRLNPYILERDSATGDYGQATKLECLLSFPLYQAVKDMSFGRMPHIAGDCLFLALAEAKLSIVAYDPLNHDLMTVSLHCFEDELLKGGYTRHLPLPIVRCDPDNRCAAMLCYGRHLAVVPYSASSDNLFDEMDTNQRRRTDSRSTTRKQLGLASYTTPLFRIDEKLCNVQDMCFLDGYFEPTLLFLFEPNQTTAGRAILRSDTYCIVGVSLNVNDRVHSIIWTVNLLPLDCLRCLPIPKPVGGIMIVAANSVIYLNQSVPSYGLAVNSNMKGFTGFPLKEEHASLKITFDGGAFDFMMASTMLLATRNGRLFVLTMMIDTTNVVRGVNLEPAGEVTTPCCMSCCGDGFVFIGSRLSNSKLYRYFEQDRIHVKVAAHHGIHSSADDVDDRDVNEELIDDYALYGEVVTVKTVESMIVTKYLFTECDAIVNIGNIKEVVVFLPYTAASCFALPNGTLDTIRYDNIFDFVCISGDSRCGMVSLLERNVRPMIVTSSEIPGAQRIFTVGRFRDGDNNSIGNQHQFLLVSKEVATMVLEVSHDMAELESSGFIMDQPTIAAADLDTGDYIVQVTPMSVVLLQKVSKKQELHLDVNFPVFHATICDPYILLITENGEVLLIQCVIDDDTGFNRHLERTPLPPSDAAATACTLYRDASGLFTLSGVGSSSSAFGGHRRQPSYDVKSNVQLPSTGDPLSSAAAMQELSTQDEDLLLYGDMNDSTAGKFKQDTDTIRSNVGLADVLFDAFVPRAAHLHDPNTVMSSYWLLVARENGLLEIFSLPNVQLVYLIGKFPYANRTLFDSDALTAFQGSTATSITADDALPIVKEIAMVGLGFNNARPHLLAVIQDQLIIYEVFPSEATIDNHLAIRFCKSNTVVIPRDAKVMPKPGKRSAHNIPQHVSSFVGKFESVLTNASYPVVAHTIEQVGEYANAVFVAGQYPYWLYLGGGELRAHPMTLDGPIRSFAPFNNVHCANGFLYLFAPEERKSLMRVARLNPAVNYDCSYPSKMIPINCGIHFIEYLMDSNTFAVTTSVAKPCTKVVTLMGDDKQFDTYEKADEPNFILPMVDWFTVSLYTPDTLEAIADVGAVDLEEFEIVTSMKEVQLKSEGVASGMQNYLVFGSIYNYGEEMIVRGRIFICEVIDVLPDPATPLTKNKLKLLYSKEQKAPITSLCSCQGYLLVGMGQKVYIWQFKDNDLFGISFIDLHFYVNQMVPLRNMTLVTDIYHSIALLRYQEEHKALSIASRDFRPSSVQPVPMGVQFVVDGSQLGFLMSDEDCNISILCYQPELKESMGGQRLVPRGDVNIGSRVASMCRLRCHISDEVVDAKHVAVNKHMALFASLDASVSVVAPLSEKVFRRLLMVQNIMCSQPQYAGVNPKSRSAWGVRRFSSAITQTAKQLIDGDICFEYLNLSFSDRHELAKRLGSSKEQLFDDIVEVIRMTTHF